jgi:hypothetical protein
MLGNKKERVGKGQLRREGGATLSQLPPELITCIVECLGRDRVVLKQRDLVHWRGTNRHFAKLLGPAFFASPMLYNQHSAEAFLRTLDASPLHCEWVHKLDFDLR